MTIKGIKQIADPKNIIATQGPLPKK